MSDKVPMLSPDGRKLRVPAAIVEQKKKEGYSLRDAAPPAAAPAPDDNDPVAQLDAAAAEAGAVEGDPSGEKAALSKHRAARASAPWYHVPGSNGKGTEDSADRGWWDKLKNAIPASVRDATLFGVSPKNVVDFAQGSAHGGLSEGMGNTVWLEPSDEEAAKAGAKTDLQREQYRDEQWDMALDAAIDSGKPLYRGSRIRGDSPDFMQVAAAVNKVSDPLATYVRGMDRMVTGGLGSAALDSPVAPEMIPALPPEEQKKARAQAAENIKRSDRMMEQNRPFAGGGALAGALVPVGAAGRAASVADKLVGAGKYAVGRNLAGQVARSGASAALSTAGTEVAADLVSNASRESAGLPTKGAGDIAMDAGTAALVAAPMGAFLGVPAAVSRRLRKAGSPHAQALAELEDGGGSTSVWNEVNPPTGSTELADLQVKRRAPSSTVVARDEAIGAIAPEVELEAGQVTAQARAATSASGYGMADDILLDASKSDDALRGAAGSIVERGQKIDEAVQNKTAQLTDKLLKRINEELPAQAKRLAFENESALIAEGAPPPTAIIGPDNLMSDAAAAAKRADELDYGLTGTSLRPIIDTHQRVMRGIAWSDGKAMPSAVGKFKDAAEKLYIRKTVAAEELPLYKEAAYDVKKMGEDSFEVLLPRHVNPRELDDFIKATDDLANYDGSGGGDSAYWKQIGASARTMRDEFKVLSMTKDKARKELLATENMLQAAGLKPGHKGGTTPATVNEAASVMNQLKGILSDRKLDSELAQRRPVLEKWLSGHDPQLFEEYVDLRRLAEQQRKFSDWSVTADGDATGATLSKLVNTIKGDKLGYDALTKTIGADASVQAARTEAQRMNSVFGALGVKVGPEVGPSEMFQLRGKLYDVLIKGGDEYDAVAASLKPAQRAQLEPIRKAANDTNEMFKTLGFESGKWSSAQRRDITDGIKSMLDKYRTVGAGKEFDEAVDEACKARPVLKAAIVKMRAERAYQALAASSKENIGLVGGKGGASGYVRGGADMISHRLDALMGTGQRGTANVGFGAPIGLEVRTPVGAPTEYATAFADSTSQDKDSFVYTAPKNGLEFILNLGRAAMKKVQP